MFKGIEDKGLLPSHSLHFHSFHAGDKCNCEWVTEFLSLMKMKIKLVKCVNISKVTMTLSKHRRYDFTN